MKKTLEQIIAKEREHRHEEGQFGIKACKEQIIWYKQQFDLGYYQQLEKYVERANKEKFFNDAMVLACWELINEV